MVYEHRVDYEEEKDFWFNQIESHGNDVFNYGEDYYIYKILKVLLPTLSLPKGGKICMLGTLNCYSFSVLEEYFGKDSCVGYDLYNPTNRKNIIEGPIKNQNISSVPSLSFCWNDLGNYTRNPGDKMFAQILFANKILPNGCFIGRDQTNRARFPVNTLMEQFNFQSSSLFDYFIKNNLDTSHIDEECLKSHLISFRKL